jgi:hypothetical protein
MAMNMMQKIGFLSILLGFRAVLGVEFHNISSQNAYIISSCWVVNHWCSDPYKGLYSKKYIQDPSVIAVRGKGHFAFLQLPMYVIEPGTYVDVQALGLSQIYMIGDSPETLLSDHYIDFCTHWLNGKLSTKIFSAFFTVTPHNHIHKRNGVILDDKIIYSIINQ